MKIIRCTVCVKSGVSCYGKESGWPDVQWRASWRLWDLPVFSGVKVRTTVSRKTVAAGDRVNRQFVAERPDQLWVADFTYGVPGVQGGHGCLNEPRVCLEY